VTNHPEHDPDIQHIPFFAISSKFFNNLWSTYYKRVMPFDAFSQTMIGVQHKIYYVVLSLARFNLYANSYGYLASKKAKRNGFWYCELAGIAFFWTYFGLMLRSQPSWKMRLAYLLVSHIATSPVHVQVSESGLEMKISEHVELIADRSVALCLLDRRPGPDRILPVQATPDNDGRRVLRRGRVHSWWSALAGHAPSVPPSAAASAAQSQSARQGVLQGAGDPVPRTRLARGVSVARRTPARTR